MTACRSRKMRSVGVLVAVAFSIIATGAPSQPIPSEPTPPATSASVPVSADSSDATPSPLGRKGPAQRKGPDVRRSSAWHRVAWVGGALGAGLVAVIISASGGDEGNPPGPAPGLPEPPAPPASK